LLYAAPIKFNTIGTWRMQVLIECGRDAVKVACDIPVAPPPRGSTSLIPYLAGPPLAVALFAINQFLRKKPRTE
jgi:hypothetical protein